MIVEIKNYARQTPCAAERRYPETLFPDKTWSRPRHEAQTLDTRDDDREAPSMPPPPLGTTNSSSFDGGEDACPTDILRAVKSRHRTEGKTTS